MCGPHFQYKVHACTSGGANAHHTIPTNKLSTNATHQKAVPPPTSTGLGIGGLAGYFADLHGGPMVRP